MGALFVRHHHADGAIGASIGIDVVVVAQASDHFGVAVAPIDGVAAGGVLTRVGDGPQSQGIGRALIDRCVTRKRDAGGNVIHRDGLGVGPGAVFVRRLDGDGAIGVAVEVGVGHVAALGCKLRCRQHSGCAAVAPIDTVTGDGIRPRITAPDVQGIQAALRRGGIPTQVQGRSHIIDRDGEAVASLLGAIVVEGDGNRVIGVAVGVGVTHIERTGVEGTPAGGRAIAPIHGVEPARRAGVGGIGEIDRLDEEAALVHRTVRTGIDGEHLGGRTDGDRLGFDGIEGAILIDQADSDGLWAHAGIAVGDLPVAWQAARQNGLDTGAIAPVDAVFAHRIGTGVEDIAEGQRIDLILLDTGVARQAEVRRHIAHRHLEAAVFDAVGLPLAVVGGDGHRIDAVVGIGVADIEQALAGVVDRVGRAVAPIHRDLDSVRIRVAEGQGMGEETAFRSGTVGPHTEARRIIDVGQVDVGMDRRRGEGNPVAPRPGELVQPEEVQIALIGQLVGLQVGQADFLSRHDGHAIQLDRAAGRQGGDLDGSEVLAFRIVEAGNEQGGGQDQ